VLVDDGSTDDTADRLPELLQRHGFVRFIHLTRRFGTETAILAGLESSIGDFVVVMVPGHDPPALVPELVDLARRGFGIVSGVRRTRAHEPWLVRTGARAFYWYCNRVLHIDVPANSTFFRVLSRAAVNAVIRIKDRLRHFRVYGTYIGFPAATFPYDPLPAPPGGRRTSLADSVRRSIGIVIANSTHPLRVASFAGLVASGSCLVYAAYVVVTYFVKKDVAPGWATLSLLASAMFFFVFLVLAILCEYVGRILLEAQDRPQYFVLGESKSSIMLREGARLNVVEDPLPERPPEKVTPS
jgi:glycosyltransferase involved in cell wall biosynthesis